MSQLIEEIKAMNRKFMEAVANKDAKGVAACYAPDAQFLPPNSDPVSGRAGIEALIQSMLDGGVAKLVIETSEAHGDGAWAWESGVFHVKLADGNTADRGKYIVIWKKTGSGWLIHRDIINTSLPAA